jgi:3-oxoacyl-ACP reductase-like protein
MAVWIASLTLQMSLAACKNLLKKSVLRHAIAKDNAMDFQIINGVEAEQLLQSVNVIPRASFLSLESVKSLSDLPKLHGLIDLEKVIVITGFAEVGLWVTLALDVNEGPRRIQDRRLH